VTPENADAWDSFKTAHLIFAPFANIGWSHYDKMAEMCPQIAKGTHVLNAAGSQFTQLSSDSDQNMQSQSMDHSSQSTQLESSQLSSNNSSSHIIHDPDDSDIELDESMCPEPSQSTVNPVTLCVYLLSCLGLIFFF
jgi:hypothetical protein